ncbi:23S rRNA (adenine(2503)-C(2))-methyltransferase RlmN [Desulfococcaceae bacterium OttesenSCG-928-F15]|nr:23S rRNA (adenine(2503)-C(2))-methyltransferase RlmN [Desulfococcaceae bacterium OttesenSCG-928-F15]
MNALLAMTCKDLENWLRQKTGKGFFHASALYGEVLGKGNPDFGQHAAFERSKGLSEKILQELVLFPDAKIIETAETEGNLKFVTRLSDGFCIESVILSMDRHETLCLSTQVGCRMGCAFCETGKMGFIRNLLPEEIVFQLFAARFHLKRPIRNLVYMGMGEPLDNFSSVLKAIEVFSDQRGANIPLSRQTLSTVGLVPAMNDLALRNLRSLHLAVSLNAARDSLRSKLMPVNRAYDLSALRKAILDYPLPPRGVILLSYIVIPGVNDGGDDLEALVRFARGLPVRINLIPCNPDSSKMWPAAEDEDVHRFGEGLYKEGLFVRKRWSRGRELAAGCGQLGKKHQPRG